MRATYDYYMADSVSGQDGPNPVPLLSKIAQSCPQGITHCVSVNRIYLVHSYENISIVSSRFLCAIVRPRQLSRDGNIELII